MEPKSLSWEGVEPRTFAGLELEHKKDDYTRRGRIVSVDHSESDRFIFAVCWFDDSTDDIEVFPTETRLFNAGCECVVFHHSELGVVIVRSHACAKTSVEQGRGKQVL